MKVYFHALFLSMLSVFAVGCQTTQGVVLSETPLAIRQTRIVINSVFGEARVISQNGREISTHYHDRQLKYLEITPKVQERYYTKVVILGARRPYDLDVQVHIEQRDPDTKNFQDVGLEENLSMKQARALQEALNQSRDKPHVIDEGAPF